MRHELMKSVKWITIVAIIFLAIVVAVVLLAPRFVSQDRLETQARAVELQYSLADFYGDHHRFPTSDEGLDALLSPPPQEHSTPRYFPAKTALDPDTLNDAWGRPFLYRPSKQSDAYCRIVSYGADGAPGGDGDDEDIQRICFQPS